MYENNSYETDEENEKPKWVLERGQINEPLYCGYFIKRYNRELTCIGGHFYGVDGYIEDSAIKREIALDIFPYYLSSVGTKVNKLFDALRLLCRDDDLPLQTDRIHFKNGTLSLGGDFTENKELCRNRLNMDYFPTKDAPERFIAFLRELLSDEDIFTLQEYLGYCLIPSTKGQTALFIIGSGGEGKSRIGVILKAIFGGSLISSNFQRIENDRFFLSRLVDKLVMVDDDMQLEALKSTGVIKSLITAETPFEVEEKGRQSYPAQLYTRLICFGNGSPSALYDNSDAFSRRLLILSAKPKDPNRKDDPFICEKLLEEKHEIINWMLQGLQRLMINNFRFTVSEKTRENAKQAVSDRYDILDFFDDENMIIRDKSGGIPSAELYSLYVIWCGNNAIDPVKRKTFLSYVKTNARKLRVCGSNNIESSDGRKVRGFEGIKAAFKTHV